MTNEAHRPSIPDKLWRRLMIAGAGLGMRPGTYLVHLAEQALQRLERLAVSGSTFDDLLTNDHEPTGGTVPPKKARS